MEEHGKSIMTLGGSWTREKLKALEDYLKAYLTIMKGNKKARFYKVIYVDAFAGCGYLKIGPEVEYIKPILEAEVQNYLKGSTKIALEASYKRTEEGFDEYVFVELDPEKAKSLKALREKYSEKLIKVVNDDANRYLIKFCNETDWNMTRALVFLDPYGMQVEWKLLEKLAETKAVDCWILFPLGVAVNRLLKKDGNIDEVRRQRLNRLFGTKDWYERFYQEKTEKTLFGENSRIKKTSSIAEIGKYFRERLQSIFAGVSQYKLLRNSRNSPIYMLIFAVANPDAVGPALRIANYILGKRRRQ